MPTQSQDRLTTENATINQMRHTTPNAALAARATPTDPLVSVIISNYNYGAYLGDAIRSVQQQTYRNTEIIVVDDGSTDNSRAVIDCFEEQITVIFNQHRGQCAALNTGLAVSHGAIILFLDADDYLVDNAIERLVAPLVDNPAATKVQGAMIAVDSSGKSLGRKVPGFISPSGDYKKLTLEVGPWTCRHSWTSGIAWQRWFLERVFPLPEGSERRNDADGCLNPVATLFGPIISLDEPVAYYRIHGRNIGPVGEVFTLESLSNRLLRMQHTYDFFLPWARHFGATSATIERWRKWKRSWKSNLTAYVVNLMDSSHPRPSFKEVVFAPLMTGSTSPLKSAGLVAALAVIRISPRKLALVFSRRLLRMPNEPRAGNRDIENH
ncbi:glycosyltransferase family 2 protein [uncultured Lamprocystis sp.]|uniref:glycosyltransferase family 2 protein n=2 Tax=uncultured Lamprocystis sp. TaxID=543132 RepID=UPI0025DA415C|nr:glycosyltransferase family 2 protein [uncultured Lamprocystis sp.]